VRGCWLRSRLHEELRVAGDGERLLTLTAGGVGKALQLLAERAEYMAAGGPDVRLFIRRMDRLHTRAPTRDAGVIAV
jgi:hypothetical protein